MEGISDFAPHPALHTLEGASAQSSIYLPPVASNGLGEYQARRTTGLRRASRQESASVVVSRWRHPNRRSAFQAVFSS